MENSESNNFEFIKITSVKHDKQGLKILNDKYKIIKLIGQGTYSKVKLAINITTGNEYALKIIHKGILSRKKKGYSKDKNGNMVISNLLQDALKEIEILKAINHQNIVNLIEILEHEKNEKIYLVMDLAKKGNFMNFHEKLKIFTINDKFHSSPGQEDYSEDDLRVMIKDLASGLNYLHSKGIVHRDIKPDNILIDENNRFRLSDFNVAFKIENEFEKTNKTEGTTFFYAPECCKNEGGFLLKPVDVWAVGINIFIALFKTLPYIFKTEINPYQIVSVIAKGEVPLPNTRKISSSLNNLLERIFEIDPTKRITAEEILKHPFVLNQPDSITELLPKKKEKSGGESCFPCFSQKKAFEKTNSVNPSVKKKNNEIINKQIVPKKISTQAKPITSIKPTTKVVTNASNNISKILKK